ncbi:SDR family NAD(P)-dependent oxidoreductase [Catenovulum agarivorans]|uniref:SDR family NAD(P)-dependent oxidoreductase n=1 Tax=Catenovulum agarivorans TaxID=1172192 RepID=UPI0002D32668|nr:SDR family NAD(P)-dependent oxidoreductase [Catenovulum agarivorans]
MQTLNSNKTILITGASGGIGFASAKLLARAGYSLILHGRNADKLAEVKAQLLTTNSAIRIEYLTADLAETDVVASLFKQVQQFKLPLYGLVHCAGSLYEAPLMMLKPVEIHQQLQLHVTSAIELAQYASRFMLRQKQGSIVFVSSVVANQGAAGQSVYAAAKSALSGLTKSLAKELGAQGIRVNCVSPGFIQTELVAHYNEQQQQSLQQQTMLKRLGQADDVAELIEFLLSDKASYITAQEIAVDGGLTLP